jgi:hypothetical protein
MLSTAHSPMKQNFNASTDTIKIKSLRNSTLNVAYSKYRTFQLSLLLLMVLRLLLSCHATEDTKLEVRDQYILHHNTRLKVVGLKSGCFTLGNENRIPTRHTRNQSLISRNSRNSSSY